MDTEESLKKFEQGKDAWNTWAKGLLGQSERDEKWDEQARVNFIGHSFENDADFRDFVFPDIALFDGATFKHEADFSGTTFHGLASFGKANFRFSAGFSKSNFKDKAWFSEVRFENDDGTGPTANFSQAIFEDFAWFWGAIFGGRSEFWGAVFLGHAEFCCTTHRVGANFLAVQGKSAFMMERAKFSEVPDFIQAAFLEAPRLDDIEIDRGIPPMSLVAVKTLFRGNREREARWRALKRLAMQGHDHALGQRFFAEELLARRWVTDKPWHGRYWFGLLYQIFSNFGRSLLLPLAWLAGELFIFTGAYYCLRHDAEAFPGAGANPLSCASVNTGESLVAAFSLSLHRSLAGLSSMGERLPDFHASLYGVCDGSSIVPNVVSFLGVVQTVISAGLIFLFLLALRNFFRIR